MEAVTVRVSSTTLTLLQKQLVMNDLDRRVSVAPMMDWSDRPTGARRVNQLRNPKMACPHSVSTLQSRAGWAG